MKKILPLIIASTISSHGAVAFDFPNGALLDASNQQVGTFVLTSRVGTGPTTTLTGTTDIQAFQIAGTTNLAIQGQGSDFDNDPTISLTINLTDSRFSIQSFNVASTETVNGAPPANEGFNIGNGNNVNNAADLGLTFNVDGTFTADASFMFDQTNSDILANGPLAAGQTAAADTLTSGNHSDDTFLFVSSSPVGNGQAFETTITSFDDFSISGEAFRFDVVIVPEPSSTALLGLGGLLLIGRRKRA